MKAGLPKLTERLTNGGVKFVLVEAMKESQKKHGKIQAAVCRIVHKAATSQEAVAILQE